MDPNKTLEQTRSVCSVLDRQVMDLARPVDREMVVILLGLVEAMDTWLASGGFLPQGWTPKQREEA